jgi:predicted transcriptional regulator
MPTISTRFDDDTIKRLTEIAAETKQPRSALIKNAVGHYLDYMAWYSDSINAAYDDIRAGRVKSHAQVKAGVRELGLNVD